MNQESFTASGFVFVLSALLQVLINVSPAGPAHTFTLSLKTSHSDENKSIWESFTIIKPQWIQRVIIKPREQFYTFFFYNGNLRIILVAVLRVTSRAD